MVLITGGFGFLGTSLVHLMQESCPDIRLLLPRKDLSRARGNHPPELWTSLPQLGPEQIGLHEFDSIIHLASTLSNDWEEIMKTDIPVLRRLVDTWQKGHFVFSSSFDVYGYSEDFIKEDSPAVPLNLYGLGKLLAEKFIQMGARTKERDRKTVFYKTLRIPYILGPHPDYLTSFFGRMISRALQDLPFEVDGGASVTSWIGMDDLTGFIARHWDKPISGTFNIKSGSIAIQQAIELIIRVTGSRSDLAPLAGGRSHTRSRVLNTERLERDFSFSPRCVFEEEIRKILGGLIQDGTVKDGWPLRLS